MKFEFIAPKTQSTSPDGAATTAVLSRYRISIVAPLKPVQSVNLLTGYLDFFNRRTKHG